MAGYVMNFGAHGLFDPNGRIGRSCTADEITEHNRRLAEREVATAKITGEAVFYLVKTKLDDPIYPGLVKWEVTTWDGSFRWNAGVKESWHNMAGRNGRRDAWFKFGGQMWHGVSIGDSQICRCKRPKQTRPRRRR